MRKGSIPRPVAVPLCPNYAPDGLTETDIDSLIAAVDSEVAPVRPRPGWLSSDPTEHRRARHKLRQVVRSLPTVFTAGPVTSDDGEAA